METNEDKQDYTRHAIAVMTEWANSTSVDQERERVYAAMTSAVEELGGGDDVLGLHGLVVGFISLCGFSLTDLAGADGRESDVIRDLAYRISGH